MLSPSMNQKMARSSRGRGSMPHRASMEKVELAAKAALEDKEVGQPRSIVPPSTAGVCWRAGSPSKQDV